MSETKGCGDFALKATVIGCASIAFIFIIAVIAGIIFLCTIPEGGVMLSNNINQAALTHLKDNKILGPNENAIAYYDVTMFQDGSESATVTNKRVVYHKNGINTSIDLKDIHNIRYRKESLIGDVFEIEAKDGNIILIEIAPLNKGETFKNALYNEWNKNK